jgi:hypothetical protein
MSEHDEQAAFIRWAEASRGKHPALHFLFAIPNGGHRHKATAGKLKAEGVRAGIPDLFLAYPVVGMEQYFGGLFIEMKTQTGRLSTKQKHWTEQLAEVGYAVAVCHGTEQAIKATRQYLAGEMPTGVQTFKDK